MVLKLSSQVLAFVITPSVSFLAWTSHFVSIAKRAIASPELLPAVVAVLPKTVISKVASTKALRRAWFDLDRSNPDSSGSDGVTIRQFETDLEKNLKEISKLLQQDKYVFSDAKGVLLKKGDGGWRPLKIGVIKDRIVTKSIALHISPRLNKFDLDCSHAYRKKRSTRTALQKIELMAQLGCNWVLEADIQKFFDKVDRDILKRKLRRVIRSDAYVDLIVKALSSEMANPTKQDEDYLSQFPSADSGIPQGNILSPLLANYYLHSFDKAMLDKGLGLVRYADDFVVMCKSRAEAEEAFAFASKFLKTNLSLDLHPLAKNGKSDITLYRDGFDFLGFQIGAGILKPSKKAIKRLHERIKEIFLESVQISPLVRKINRINSGYKGWVEAFTGSSMSEAARSADEVLADELTKLLLKEKFLRRGDRLSFQQIKIIGVYTLRERLSKRHFKSVAPNTPQTAPHHKQTP